LLNNIPLYSYATFYLSIVDILVVSLNSCYRHSCTIFQWLFKFFLFFTCHVFKDCFKSFWLYTQECHCWSYDNFMFHFLRNHCPVFHSSCTRNVQESQFVYILTSSTCHWMAIWGGISLWLWFALFWLLMVFLLALEKCLNKFFAHF
jgi:hypothetical protein